MRGWRWISAPTSSNELQIRPITHFDNLIATLADPGRPDQIQVERSAAYLNRRLFDNPRASYVVSGAYRTDQCMGYIAWQIATRQDSQSWLHIIDWQTSTHDRDATLRALLDFTSRKAEAAACGFVMLVLQSQDQRHVIRRAGFVTRRSGSHKIVGIHANDSTLLATLTATDWSLTDLSEDNDGY